MMKTAGSAVASFVFPQIHKDAANTLAEVKWQCNADLARIGIAQDRAAELIARAEAQYLRHVSLCESPIEQMMLAAMAFMVIDAAQCFPPAIHDVMSGDPWPASPVVIVPQFVIARFRLDFLVSIETDGRPFQIAVECDGKEHHTSRKDIAKDEARDAYLKRLGIQTWRLTGGWIYKAGWKVADELAAVCSWKDLAA
jgi:hypothetical protein